MKIIAYSRSKNKEKFIKAAAKFYIKLLNLQQSRYTVYIATRPHLKKTDGARGIAAKVDKKEIVIGIDSSLPIAQTLLTLAHEMVHVKQIARGQYKSEIAKNGRVLRYWCGKKVVADYFDRPWEIEAFKREGILLEKYCKHLQRKHKIG